MIQGTMVLPEISESLLLIMDVNNLPRQLNKAIPR